MEEPKVNSSILNTGNLRTLLVVLLTAIVVASCCTKKHCEEEVFPEIVISYHNFSDMEFQNSILYILNKDSLCVIDSVENSYPKNVVVIKSEKMYSTFGEYRDIDQYAFILKTLSRKGTIANINYETFYEEEKCNNCFLTKDEVIIKKFRGLNFEVNCKHYSDIYTVKIDSGM